MGDPANDAAQDQFSRAILEALPVPVFVVDDDFVILRANEAALKLLAQDRAALLHRRGGEVMHCVHAQETGRCGRSQACRSCLIRQSIAAAFKGQPLGRRPVRMEWAEDAGTKEVHFLVTTSPIDFAGRRHVLVVLEDVTELVVLRKLLPICARCKKIRDEQRSWHRLETYLGRHLNMTLTHSFCPDCTSAILADAAGASEKPLAQGEHS